MMRLSPSGLAPMPRADARPVSTLTAATILRAAAPTIPIALPAPFTRSRTAWHTECTKPIRFPVSRMPAPVPWPATSPTP
jgi:hypothetical protein